MLVNILTTSFHISSMMKVTKLSQQITVCRRWINPRGPPHSTGYGCAYDSWNGANSCLKKMCHHQHLKGQIALKLSAHKKAPERLNASVLDCWAFILLLMCQNVNQALNICNNHNNCLQLNKYGLSAKIVCWKSCAPVDEIFNTVNMPQHDVRIFIPAQVQAQYKIYKLTGFIITGVQQACVHWPITVM